MATIVTRSGKGSALTHTEMDANFNNLNGDKVETSAIGTAASSDVTASATDTTAGRLLKVGDFGFSGTGATLVAPSGLLSNLAYTCAFRFDTAETDRPFNYGTGISLSRSAIDYSQIAITRLGSPRLAFRHSQTGTASSWQEIYHTGNEQQIGVNQTWQDVTSSRVAGVTYTNTTGKPITFLFEGFASGTNQLIKNLSVNGIGVGVIYGDLSSAERTQITIVVPPGATYEVSNAAGTITIHNWQELR